MRSLCGRWKIKYIFILGLALTVVSYLLLLRERTSISLATEHKALIPHIKHKVGNAFTSNFQARNFKVNSAIDELGLGELVDKTGVDSSEEGEREYEDKKRGSVNVYVVEEHHEGWCLGLSLFKPHLSY